MKRVCAWCPPAPTNPDEPAVTVTHGICEMHREQEWREIRKLLGRRDGKAAASPVDS